MPTSYKDILERTVYHALISPMADRTNFEADFHAAFKKAASEERLDIGQRSGIKSIVRKRVRQRLQAVGLYPDAHTSIAQPPRQLPLPLEAPLPPGVVEATKRKLAALRNQLAAQAAQTEKWLNNI